MLDRVSALRARVARKETHAAAEKRSRESRAQVQETGPRIGSFRNARAAAASEEFGEWECRASATLSPAEARARLHSDPIGRRLADLAPRARLLQPPLLGNDSAAPL